MLKLALCGMWADEMSPETTVCRRLQTDDDQAISTADGTSVFGSKWREDQMQRGRAEESKDMKTERLVV
jgi:hypothetical protein